MFSVLVFLFNASERIITTSQEMTSTQCRAYCVQKNSKMVDGYTVTKFKNYFESRLEMGFCVKSGKGCEWRLRVSPSKFKALLKVLFYKTQLI